MTRAFETTPVDPSIVDRLLDAARRAPSAGNTASVQFLVLSGGQTADYWDTTLPAARRDRFPWPRLLDAPVLIIPWVDPGAYVVRYREPDKSETGLGGSIDDWPVPYWFVDGGAVTMCILLGAEEAGLGALFFGLFEHEGAVRARFGVPDELRAIGAIALGHGAPDRPSQSATRPRAAFAELVHRGEWHGLV